MNITSLRTIPTILVFFVTPVAYSASVNGLWTGQSFYLKSSGIIKKGQAIDNLSPTPKLVNLADIKVKFECYLQIGQYDDAAKTYDFVTACKGKKGWEIADWGTGSFIDLVNNGLGHSHYMTELRIGLTTTDGSAWDVNTHWGTSGTYAYYTGQYVFTPKMDGANIKSATFMNPTIGLIGYENWTADTDVSGLYKSNMSAKYSTGKVDATAKACLDAYAAAIHDDGNTSFPCDPS